MQLFYTMRLICLVLCGTGLLQLVVEYAAWSAANALFRRSVTQNPRLAKRLLFSLALFGRLAAPLLVIAVWLPAYVRGEENHASERVGTLCLAGAASVLTWCLLGWFRAASAWFAARRHCARSRPVGSSPEGLPMLLSPECRPLLAVVGFLRPRLLVSGSFLRSEWLTSDALALAFQHESAHARHRDNLKLLALSLLPHIPFSSTVRPSVDRLWRLAAEMAADEEALQGRHEDAVLLAELLVRLARESTSPITQASLGLFSGGEDLRARVDRLLARANSVGCEPVMTRIVPHSVAVIACCAVLMGALGWCCSFSGHRSAEVLLHARLALGAQTR